MLWVHVWHGQNLALVHSPLLKGVIIYIYIYNVRIKCCQLGHSHVIQDLSFHQRAGRIGQQEPRRLPEYPGHVGHGEIWLVGLTKTVRDIRAKGRFLLALETFLQAIEAKEKASW